MNVLDLLILLALAGGMVRGFTTGIIRQVAGFVGLVVSFFVAVKLMDVVGAVAVTAVGASDRLAPVVGFIVVFVALQAVLSLLIRIVEALVGAMRLTTVNRVLGGVLGALKAALVLSVAFLLLGYLGVPQEDSRTGSTFYYPVAAVMPQAWELVTGQLPEVKRLAAGLGEAGEEWFTPAADVP